MTEFNLTKCLCSHYFVHIRCLNFMTRLVFLRIHGLKPILKFNIQPLFIVCTRILNCVSYEMCKQYLSKYKLQWQKAFYFSVVAFLAASVHIRTEAIAARHTCTDIPRTRTACSTHLKDCGFLHCMYSTQTRTRTHTLSRISYNQRHIHTHCQMCTRAYPHIHTSVRGCQNESIAFSQSIYFCLKKYGIIRTMF